MGEKNSIPPHLIELRAVPSNGETVTEPLKIWIDPGNASPAEIADLLHALSEVHRAAGGSGLSWSIEGDAIEEWDAIAASEAADDEQQRWENEQR